MLSYADANVQKATTVNWRLAMLFEFGLRDQALAQTLSWRVQVRVMQTRLPCAARLMSWTRGRGLAVNVLACALMRRKHEAGSVKVSLDWEACELHCDML